MWYDGVTDRTMDFSVSTKFAILGLIECLEKAGFSVNQGAIIVRDLSGEMGIPFGDPHPGASKNILRRSIIRWRKEKAGLANIRICRRQEVGLWKGWLLTLPDFLQIVSKGVQSHVASGISWWRMRSFVDVDERWKSCFKKSTGTWFRCTSPTIRPY